jgi:hypothetical protein
MSDNAKKDGAVVLGGREFKRVKNGLDETQVASFIDELIKERDKLAQSQDHIQSLNRLAEMRVVEADKLAARIKAEASEQAKADSTAVIDKAKEQARQMAEQKIAEAVEIANENAKAIKAKAEEEAALLLENQKNKIRTELHNLVNQQFGYMLEELEGLKRQAAAVQADFDNKLSSPDEENSTVASEIAEENDNIIAKLAEESDAAAEKIAEESDNIIAKITEESGAAAEKIAEESAAVAEQEDTIAAEEKETIAAEQEDTAVAEESAAAAEQEDTIAAEEKETVAAEQEDTAVAEESTAAAEQKDTIATEEQETVAAEEKDTVAAEQSNASYERPEPSQATEYAGKSSELSKLLEIEDQPELGKPQWEVEILPPFDISKIMEVVSYLDQLPEVANTEMIVPQIDTPSILVFLRGSLNFIGVLQKIPAVAHVEEVTTDEAATNGEPGKGPRKVRISLAGNTASQEK